MYTRLCILEHTTFWTLSTCPRPRYRTRSCMCMCVCTFMDVCMYVCIRDYASWSTQFLDSKYMPTTKVSYAFLYVHVCVCICMDVCMYVYETMHLGTHNFLDSKYMPTTKVLFTFLYVHICACIYMCVWVCVCVCVCVYAHTRIT